MSFAKGPITKFPADGLRASRRFISSHNKDGKGVFVVDDDGDHHRIMCNGQAAANIIYSTADSPVDMNNDKDLIYARDNEVRISSPPESDTVSRNQLLTAQPAIHVANGSCVRLIDFAPGMESPIHRAMSIDYGVVIEGKFLFTLDSGETKIMLPGDTSKIYFSFPAFSKVG